jgi:hypothetical protein
MEILRLDRQQFYEWRNLGLLGTRKGRERLSRADVRELAVLAGLQRVIGGTKAGIAYRQIRAQVTDRELRAPTEVMWSDRDRWAGLVESPEQFLEVARRGQPVLLIPVHTEARRVLEAFDREVTGRNPD